jgi:drug/metabolite transporter (DMT)-like permease
MSPLFALGASLTYGVADFTAAIAARRVSALTVAMGTQVVGVLLVLPLLPFLPGRVSVPALVIGGLAGGAGIFGLATYLKAMAAGPIGVVSPLAAVSGAAVPVAWGAIVLGETFSSLQMVGIGLALVSVVVVAWVPGTAVGAADLRSVAMGLAAGVLFGSYFIALDATPIDSGLWPLVSGRVLGIAVILVVMRALSRPTHPGPALGLVVASGVLDMTANVLFLLATRGGLLSVSALLSSLYPVVALVLARTLLQERVHPVQGLGVVGSLIATGLIVGG